MAIAMKHGWGWGWAGGVVLVMAAGCADVTTLECGPGTVQEGRLCVPDDEESPFPSTTASVGSAVFFQDPPQLYLVKNPFSN